MTSGERTIVGVNRFQTDEDPPEVEGYELDEKGRARQLERLAEVKRSRSAADVRATLAALAKAAAQDERQPDAAPDRLREGVLHGG